MVEITRESQGVDEDCGHKKVMGEWEGQLLAKLD